MQIPLDSILSKNTLDLIYKDVSEYISNLDNEKIDKTKAVIKTGLLMFPEKESMAAKKDYIIEQFCEYYNVGLETIMLKTNKRSISVLKHRLVFVLKVYCGMNSYGLRDTIGYNNHASVYHAMNSVLNLYDTDKLYREQMDELCDFMYMKKICDYNRAELYRVLFPTNYKLYY